MRGNSLTAFQNVLRAACDIDRMARHPQSPTSRQEAKKTPAQTLLSAIGAGLRKIPTTFVLVLIGIFIIFRSPDEEQPSEQHPENSSAHEEPPPPADLPAHISPAFWTCVYRTDTQLSESRWSDVYYGMEASDAGRVVSVSVSQEWANLTPDQRATVVELVATIWQKNSQDLAVFAPGDGVETVTLKRAEDDTLVAVWTPDAGVRLVEQGAES